MSDEKTIIDFSEIPECACFNLRKAGRAVTQYYDRVLKPVGLRSTQFTILSVLAGKGRETITALAKLLIMDRTTLTRNLRPLTQQGWVQIRPGRDQRTREIELTAAGQQIFEQALPLWKAAQNRIRSGLGDTQFTAFLELLNQTVSLSVNE